MVEPRTVDLLPVHGLDAEPGLGSGHPADGDESATGAQNVDEGLPQGACGVEGKIGLPAAGPGEGMPQLVGEVCCGPVDDSGGTELEGAGGLVVGGGDRDDSRAGRDRDLDGQGTHSRGGGADDHGLAWLEAASGHQGPPRSEPGHRQRRGLAPAEVGRLGVDVGRRHRDVLRVGAVSGRAEDLVLGTRVPPDEVPRRARGG
jgi:hypothetical protein